MQTINTGSSLRKKKKNISFQTIVIFIFHPVPDDWKSLMNIIVSQKSKRYVDTIWIKYPFKFQMTFISRLLFIEK